MGLLSRAVSKTVPEFDVMGTALRDRILRLPRKKTSPDTALSLLKAYGSFQSALCLGRKKEHYISYAGLGLGVEKISVPQAALLALFEREESKRYYKLESPDFIPVKTPGLIFWGFPLDGEVPWNHVLILGAEAASGFNPQGMDRMLQDIREVLKSGENAGEKQAPRSAGQGEASGGPSRDSIEKEIAHFHHTCSPFSGIVFEAADSMPEAERPLFQKRLLTMVSLSGVTIPLTPLRSLVLLSTTLDRELIAHRIVKSLHTRTLRIFDADSPGEALSAIRSFLS
jgi:hypothetical protein